MGCRKWHSFRLSLSNKPLPFLFSDFATDVLTIPSSEIAVERVFASLSLITSNDIKKKYQDNPITRFKCCTYILNG